MANNVIQWAQQMYNRYAAKVADLLGVQLQHIHYVVLPPDDPRFHGGQWSADTEGQTTYLPSDMGKDEGLLVFEMVNALNTAVTGETKDTMALAQAIREKLTGGNSGGEVGHLSALDDASFKAAAAAIKEGTFTKAGDYRGAKPDGQGDGGGGGGQKKAAQDIVDQVDPTMRALLDGSLKWSAVDPALQHTIISAINFYTHGANYGMHSNATDILTGVANLSKIVGPLNYTQFVPKDAGGSGGGLGDSWVDPKTGLPVPAGTPGAVKLTDYIKNITGQQGADPKNLQASYLTALQGLGIDVDANLQQLMQHASQQGWSMARFKQAVYDTPEFHQEFPGIFDNQGNLRMTPQQYIQTKQSYISTAAQYGVNASPKTIAWMFRNEVSPQEFASRAQAINSLQNNQQYFRAFNETLKAQGMDPLSRGDQLRFVLGEGNKEWYNQWQNASTRYSAQQAGIDTQKGGMYTSIGEHLLGKIADKGLSVDAMNQAWQQVGQNLLTALPDSRIQGYNLTKKQIAEASFGGPHQARTRQRIQDILNQEQAFYQQRASADLVTTPSGGIGERGRGQVAQGA